MNYLRRLLQPFSAAKTHTGTPPSATAAMSQVTHINYEDMKKVAATGGVPVFDVRSPGEFAVGQIPTSVNIPVDQMEEALKMNPEDFKNKFSVNKPKPEDDFIVHCQMGGRSARATEIAVAQGYKNVKNYSGGYKEWSEKSGR